MQLFQQTIFVKLLVLLTTLVLFLSGCSTHQAHTQTSGPGTPQQANETEASLDAGLDFDADFDLEAEFDEAEDSSPIDPLSGYNRLMTNFNDKVYFWALKPAATGYRAVVPEGGRLGVNRFFNNLLMPVRFVNNLLQLKPKRALTELARFVMNSTVGVLGFTDPAAEKFDLQAYPEDFGQTLGHYGVGSGFHIVLPLLGPSNLRDTVGLIPDHFLDPISHLDETEAQVAIRAYKQVNYTSLHLGEYESLKKDAVDFYTFIRDGYEQRRDKLIEE